jgi:hypothetical protein
MHVSIRVNQLCTNPHSIIGSLDASFEYIGNSKRGCDVPEISALAMFVLHYRCATNDFQVSDFGQNSQDLVVDAISEHCALLVRSKILEWQHRNGFGGS